jgi:hypothetical protein
VVSVSSVAKPLQRICSSLKTATLSSPVKKNFGQTAFRSI